MGGCRAGQRCPREVLEDLLGVASPQRAEMGGKGSGQCSGRRHGPGQGGEARVCQWALKPSGLREGAPSSVEGGVSGGLGQEACWALCGKRHKAEDCARKFLCPADEGPEEPSL